MPNTPKNSPWLERGARGKMGLWSIVAIKHHTTSHGRNAKEGTWFSYDSLFLHENFEFVQDFFVFKRPIIRINSKILCPQSPKDLLPCEALWAEGFSLVRRRGNQQLPRLSSQAKRSYGSRMVRHHPPPGSHPVVPVHELSSVAVSASEVNTSSTTWMHQKAPDQMV